MKLVIEHFQKYALKAVGDIAKSSNMLSESQHAELFGDIIHVVEGETDPDRYGHGIEYTIFRTVWDDPIRFPSYADMYDALHPEKIDPPKDKSKAITRAVTHFKKFKSDMGSSFRDQQERLEWRIEELSTKEGREAKRGEKINPGSRSAREDTRIKKINDAELFPGKFYTNKTKIPSRNWYAWWAVWRRRQQSVPPNPSSKILDLSHLGTRWEKHFVMGYSMDQSTTYEVWYNTYNSSFSVHDKNGNPVLDSAPTVRQAISGMFTIIAKVSDMDSTYIRQVRGSVDKAFTHTLDQKAFQADAEVVKKAEKEEKKTRADNKRAEDEINQQAKSSRAWKEFKANNFKVPEDESSYTSQAAPSGSAGAGAGAEDADLRQRIAGTLDGSYNDSEGAFASRKDNKETSTRKKNMAAKDRRAVNDKMGNWSNGISSSFSEAKIIELEESIVSGDELTDASNNPLYSREANQRSVVAMSQADNSMTKQMLSSDIIGSVEQYDKTKFNTSPSVFKRLAVKMFPFLRSRKANIQTPVNTKSVIGLPSRVRGRLHGVDVRADFVTGFSLGSIDMEVWYVQELDLYDSSNLLKKFSVSKQKAGFYVYDVKSMQLIQNDIPYFRLALQTVFLKIGAPMPDQNTSDRSRDDRGRSNR